MAEARMNDQLVLDEFLAELRERPVDILGLGDAQGECDYLAALRKSYLRTIRDVVGLARPAPENGLVVEIGSFLGPVAVTLRRLGYRVEATEYPAFHRSEALRALYARHDVPFLAVDLKDAALPFADGSVDVIVVCETLEHLNFNPLPSIAEINRVLAPGGHLYIGMPNQASLWNRIRLVMGRSIHDPVSAFFDQLDSRQNMAVGLHWREYTLAETKDLVEHMGFETVRSYFYQPSRDIRSLRDLGVVLTTLYPPFKRSLVVAARKIRAAPELFHRPS
jgi:SAM-dependent methyltransferase